MDLRLGIDQTEPVVIDGSNKVFEGSEYAGLKFRVSIAMLTRSQIRKFTRESESNSGRLDRNLYMSRVFCACCLGWELKDGRGDPIPFSEENKKILVEQFPGFTNLIAAACIDAHATAVEEDALRLEGETKN